MTTVARTTPYAWPFDGIVDPARTALVVTGADALTADGTPADASAEANLSLLRSSLAAIGALVVLVSHEPPQAHGPVAVPPVACRPLVAGDAEHVVASAGRDGFYGSNLDALLRRAGRDHLIVAGLGFETTVHSTLRRANDRGYECLVVADASPSVDPSLRAASVSTIEMSGGIFGAVGTTADVLDTYRP